MNFRRQEVIDITVGTKGVASLIRDWKIFKESSNFDHKQIRLTLLSQTEKKP